MRDLSKIKNLEQLSRERELLEYRSEEQEKVVRREAGRIEEEWLTVYRRIIGVKDLVSRLLSFRK